jgi:hypothetical protein
MTATFKTYGPRSDCTLFSSKAIKGQEFYKELQKEIKGRNEYTLLDMILLLEVEMHK